jgi:hypothetical protein
MTRFGIDKVFYHCPRLEKGVLISLNYRMYKGEKIITSLDCENQLGCKTIKKHGWEKCPAYKIYIEDHH